MLGLREKIARGSRERRLHQAAKATISCETLEDRQLLSTGMSFSGMGDAHFAGRGGSMAAERGSFGTARQDGMFGGGAMGLGGGARDPILFLTAPLLSTGSSTTPPSPSVMSSSAVQSAFQTLQTDLKNDVPSGATPTHESVGALQDDLDAIHKGTLSGTAATTKIEADQAAILTSMGLTSAQVTQIQSDQSALQTAIQTASSSSTSSSTSTSTSSSSTSTSTTPSPSWSAVQTAMNTLQTALKADTPSGGQATHASIGAVEDDLDAIRKGTLTGTAAVTQVQTDAAAVLASMGLSQTQISQIQADQGAVETAIQANSSSSTSTTASTSTTSSTSTASTSTSTQSTLQSVAEYLVGLPGVQGGGMRGFGGYGGSGDFGGFGAPGFGGGPRGGF